MTAAPPILIVAGLAREARIAGGPGVTVIAAGGDRPRLRASLAEAPSCRAVISFGIAGGLDPALRPGAVVVARGVTGGGAWPSHPDILRLWIERLERSGEHLTHAILAGVDAPLVAPTEKAAVRAATGAAAADMESHLAAAFAAARRLPFAALRVVCDPAERGLPPLAAEALRPDGTLDYAAILRSLAARPAQLAALPRLARDAKAAFDALGRVRAALGPGFGLGGLSLGEPLGDVP
ncbi:MAG TPA: phosphorylase [Beijerinckiaceae bacterium]|nr:phosphorylase [Beijerinckiaceae bacterium]